MKIELLSTIKGSDKWSKGTVFDSSKQPFPSDIQQLVNLKSPLIRVFSETKIIPAPVLKQVEESVVKEQPEEPIPEVQPEEPKPSVPILKKKKEVVLKKREVVTPKKKVKKQ